MRGLWVSILLTGVLVAAPGMGMATAQNQGIGQTGRPSSPTPPSSIPPIGGRNADGSPDPLAAMQEARRVRSIANDRQKHIVDETARLLQLATELKTDVDNTPKAELSLDVARKTDEIERLAHDVKQRMKG